MPVKWVLKALQYQIDTEAYEKRLVLKAAYGPGSEKKKEERESFWNNLGELIGSFESNGIVCVLGDLNARVGDRKVQRVIGDYGVPGMNETGEWMVDWCM